jgi:hypothetical protein
MLWKTLAVTEQQQKKQSSKWLRQTFGVNIVRAVALLSVLVLSGCASSQRMSISDLNYYQIDCEKREEQIVFLRSQLTSQHDQLSSVFNTGSITGQVVSILDGTYNQHGAIRRREYDAIARVKLMELNTQCGYANPGVCDLAFPESAACKRMRR